jgi:protein SCO1/2
VWAFLIGIAVLTLMRPLLRREPDPPPVLAQLPAWQLVDQDGRPFGSADLAGQVYVASFFFTRCRSICPVITAAMGRLQDRYEEARVDGVRLVSISVDPEHDSPERLRAYGAAQRVDPVRWSLLTGPREDIERLVGGGFKTALGRPETTAGIVDIAHAGHLVLVDGEGRIRGYYGSDALGIDEVFHRSQHVLRER